MNRADGETNENLYSRRYGMSSKEVRMTGGYGKIQYNDTVWSQENG